MGTKKGRPAALARAEHGGPPARLTVAEKKVLDEALRRGEDLREELENRTLEYGRWLLEEVFDDDTTAALDDRSQNPVWRELVRRAGGPTLGVTRHLLYVALRIAANDRRITAQAWRGLDAGRKELLLPLGNERAILGAARHVSDLDLSQPKTREYVTGLLATQGTPRRVRITPRTFASRVKRLRAGLGGAATLRRLRALEMEAGDRQTVVGELEQLKDTVAEMLKALKRT